MEPRPIQNAVSKAEYARAKGVNRATITRWAQAGRLVLDGHSQVLVDESEARLAETADPTKEGVVRRHEVERGQSVLALTAADPDLPPRKGEKHESYGKRIVESTRREAANADIAEMERDRQRGVLTDVEGVKRAQADFSTMVRQTLERVPVELRQHLTAAQYDLVTGAIDAALRKIAAQALAQAELASSTRQ